MPQLLQRGLDWFRALPTAGKIVVGVLGAAAAILVSPLISILAWIVLIASLIVLVIRAIRRRPIRNWGITATISLAAVVIFSVIAGAIYGTQEVDQAATNGAEPEVTEAPIDEQPTPSVEQTPAAEEAAQEPGPAQELEPEPEPVEEPETEPDPAGPETIPGRAITDVVVLAEEEGFECSGPHIDREAPAPARVSYICHQAGITGDRQQVIARGENVSDLARVLVVAVEDYSFIEYIASLPYEGARPAEAQEWVANNLDEDTASMEIGSVYFSIATGPTTGPAVGDNPSIKTFEMVATGILDTD